MHLVEISRQLFDQFTKNHPYGSFYQTSAYGAFLVKQGYREFYLGLMDDQKQLHAASLFVFHTDKTLISNIKYAYAPRGFVLDYHNFELLKTFTTKIQSFLKEKKFSFIKIDPPIILRQLNKDGSKKIDGISQEEIFENLKHLGYQHCGYNLYFESAKPRFEAVIYKEENLFNHFHHETKNKIRSASRKGITVHKATPNEFLEFFPYIEKQRKKPLSFYQELLETLGDDTVECYVAKLDTQKYLINMTSLYQKEENNNAKLITKLQKSQKQNKNSLINRKIASDQLLTSYKHNLEQAIKAAGNRKDKSIVGGTIIIKSHDEIYFYSIGYDKSLHLPINHILRWAIINKYQKLGYERFNLSGVSGDFRKDSKYYGLLQNKISFHATINEYIGEFDLVLNPTNYQIYLNKNNPLIGTMFKMNK